MDVEAVHDALRFALDVARRDARAEPPTAPPESLRRYLRFKKLPPAALAAVHRAIDEDDSFRARVAEAADEDAVGPIGLAWLRRPDGWERTIEEHRAANSAEAGSGHGEADPQVKKLLRERAGAEAAAARARAESEAARAALARAESELGELRVRTERDQVALERLERRVDELLEERNRAVRDFKQLESTHAETRHELRVARDATREAERELAELRAEVAAKPETQIPARQGETKREPATFGTAHDGLDLDALSRAVSDAAAAAEALSASLAVAGRTLERRSGDPDATPAPAGGAAAAPATDRSASRRRRSSVRRKRPELPFGVLDGSPEGHRALVTDRRNLLMIDGYNLARTTWQGLGPEEERRRVVAMAEELQARTGARVTVIFDGSDDTVAPVASRRVSVRFSSGGATADDVLVDEADDATEHTPVVVVTSDRDLRNRLAEVGASTLASADFLVALGR